MKYIITLITLASFASIIYGFSLEENNTQISHKYIGAGTVGIFLVAMPLFLIKESKGKKLNDYMITEESLRKMQGKKSKKTDSQ